MKNKLLIIVLILITNLSFGQNKVNRKAEKAYTNFSYVKSVQQLLELAEENKATSEDLQHLANSYYFNGDMQNASKWYEELLRQDREVNSESYFRYALSLKAINNYSKANDIMNLFCELSPTDSRSILFKENINYLSDIESLSDNFELINLDVNTSLSDFGVSVYKGNLIFASSKDLDGKLYSWNEQPFLDVFQLNEDGSVDKLIGEVNTKYHESSTTFSKDGETMYFTRNNFFEGKLKKDTTSTYKLKIFKAKLVDGQWTSIESLPFNNDKYNVAHPTLNQDETKLYFASDMPGTLGASDIFMVKIHEDGSFGEPVNLGSKINTEARENFPYISNNGTLYFSSEGRIGLGGLDVYKYENIESIKTSNNTATNLGKPINSKKDDFAFIFDEVTRQGYISSNREGGKGDDDIYSFEKPLCNQLISGTVLNAITNEIILEADVTLYDENNSIIRTFKSDSKGMFSDELSCEAAVIKVIAEKEGYNQGLTNFEIKSNSSEDLTLKLSLEPKPKAAALGTDLFKLLNLNPIYFDYDKSFIRSDAEIELAKIINYMKEFPSVKVDVRSHTDSRGNDSYNLALSNRRNKSTKEYLINIGGISEDRLSGKGYGETQLTNKCSNGVKCSKEEHQANRRSEFIITEN
ncbi:OmpA family protein [Xanthomarina sp. F2636L]|uniref:OmpA family protein n=1 Tax=Xanthomarina sp. F2636L TaxID=2996018 RepID=UPI00225E554C|nr:OmpA family protein [Xanthomarina sp. F2636L]MCX7550538.1 OmpA family protein [Xanthomarina sp. F2636L]